MKKFLALVALLIVAAAAAAAWVYVRAQQPYKGFAGDEQFVELPQGAGSRTIGDRLVALRWPQPLRWLAHGVLVVAITLFWERKEIAFLYFQF